MKIVVYGTGCKSCEKLHENVLNAVKNNAINAEVIYETDLKTILNKGIMQMPALEIDGKIKSSGRVLKEKEILSFLQ